MSSLLICKHWIRRLKRKLISTESKRRRKKERKTSGISLPGSLIQALPVFLVQSPSYSSLYLLNKLMGAFGCQSARQLIWGGFQICPHPSSLQHLRLEDETSDAACENTRGSRGETHLMKRTQGQDFFISAPG